MVDLIINGTAVTLYGIQTYDIVQIINGGTLDVQAYDGTIGTGIIEIHANSILVDATSSILGDARGFRGAVGQDFVGLIRDSEGPGGGTWDAPGSGAGYGGNGGGTYVQPGIAYGTQSGTDIERGSGGGCGNTGTRWGVGGNGGALIAIYATTIEIAGTISSNGGSGISAGASYPHFTGSGGGSGGGILLSGNTIIASGTLSANGGYGSDALDWYHTGGDGGAGGRIKLFPSSVITFTGIETVIGGLGGASVGPGPGLSGEDGTIYHADIPTTGDVCIKSNPLGASITIDTVIQPGKTTAMSGTPCIIDNTVVGLSPGVDNHTYVIDLAGYQPKSGTFTIISGLTTILDIPLTPLPCPIVPKYSSNIITLKATPKDGIGPYYVVFRKNGVTIDPSRLGDLSNPIPSAPENTLITRVYTLDDLDISSALLGTIDFSVFISDSCPTGSQTCTETCTIIIGCVAPVCNFIVT